MHLLQHCWDAFVSEICFHVFLEEKTMEMLDWDPILQLLLEPQAKQYHTLLSVMKIVAGPRLHVESRTPQYTPIRFPRRHDLRSHAWMNHFLPSQCSHNLYNMLLV
jgi:hypothetical protein